MVPLARMVTGVRPLPDLLASPSARIEGRRSTIFLCSDDDDDAKTIVHGLIEAIDVEPIDAGALAAARFSEPEGFLLMGIGKTRPQGARLGLAVLQEPA